MAQGDGMPRLELTFPHSANGGGWFRWYDEGSTSSLSKLDVLPISEPPLLIPAPELGALEYRKVGVKAITYYETSLRGQHCMPVIPDGFTGRSIVSDNPSAFIAVGLRPIAPITVPMNQNTHTLVTLL